MAFIAREHLRQTDPGATLVKVVTRAKTSLDSAVVLSVPKRQISVVFRGSQQAVDWLYDLYVFKTMDELGVRVHAGFHRQLHDDGGGAQKPAIEEIADTVNDLLKTYPGFNIFVTGHSLGGALSSLCAFELSHLCYTTKVHNFSFASPRVGDRNWRTKVNARPNLLHYRIGTAGDTFTSVPSINYVHAQTWTIVLDPLKQQPTFFGPNDSYPWFSQFAMWSNVRPLRHSTTAYWQALDANKW